MERLKPYVRVFGAAENGRELVEKSAISYLQPSRTGDSRTEWTDGYSRCAVPVGDAGRCRCSGGVGGIDSCAVGSGEDKVNLPSDSSRLGC